MILAPLDSGLFIRTDTAVDKANPPPTAELGLPGTLTPLGTAVEEKNSWLTFPPKGDREMNVGVEASLPEAVEEIDEAPRLPINALLTFDAIAAEEAGTSILVVLCRLAEEVEGLVGEMVKAMRLPIWALIFDALVALRAGIPISVALCRLAVEVDEACKPVNTAVRLFSTIGMDDSDSYPGGTPEEGPLGYGNLVTKMDGVPTKPPPYALPSNAAV